MTEAVTFRVSGMAPQPKGSKRHVGGGRLIESCKQLPAWMKLVSSTAAALGAPMIVGPISLSAVFVFPRPKGHLGKRGLKPSAPRWHAVKPDGDKLLRGLADSLTGVLIEDDARVVSFTGTKRYAVGDELPGAVITIVQLAP